MPTRAPELELLLLHGGQQRGLGFLEPELGELESGGARVEAAPTPLGEAHQERGVPLGAHEHRREVLPRIREKYGEQVEWKAYDRSDEINYRALLILGEVTDLPQEARGAVPLVFMGDEFSVYARFLGGIEIDQYLEPAIDWYAGIGGADWPGWKKR